MDLHVAIQKKIFAPQMKWKKCFNRDFKEIGLLD